MIVKRALDMKLSVIIIILYVLAILSYSAAIEVGYKGDEYCESGCLYEIDKIPKFDSAKHYMIAKYCLDSTFRLLSLYEQIFPLAIKIQKECHSHSIDGQIYLEPLKIFFGGLSGGWNSCIAYRLHSTEKVECKTDINEYYNIYEYIKRFGIDDYFEKTDNISYLLSKYFPIKWDLIIECDDEEIAIPIPENYYIYISGICNEEQLKKIEALNKAGKEK